MDFEQARFNMVEQQIRPWEVLDQDVLGILMKVRRECFVPQAYQNLAFADVQIPLGKGQVMLEPKLEAKVLQALVVKPNESVLEVGTGSGHMAALLAAQADWVRSIEIEPELAAQAHRNLQAAGIENVIVEEGDGAAGWPSRAPFDVIVLSGGVAEVPAVLFEQLKPRGRLFAFVGAEPVMRGTLFTKHGDGSIESVAIFDTVVPELRLPARASFEF